MGEREGARCGGGGGRAHPGGGWSTRVCEDGVWCGEVRGLMLRPPPPTPFTNPFTIPALWCSESSSRTRPYLSTRVPCITPRSPKQEPG